MAERWYPGWGLALLRVTLGSIFLVHGWYKIFDWGVGGFAEFLADARFPVVTALAWIVTAVEFGGGMLLLVGWLTRWAAIPLFLEMLVAMLVIHVENGFFVYQPAGQWGYEYAIALLGGLGCMILAGGGKLSVDDWFVRRVVVVDSGEL
jgi:putative oxidoreductase